MADVNMNSMKRALELVAGEDGEAERKKQKRQCKDFQPRSYQIAIFEVALQHNTIAMLDTGAGKTLIAVMLIKHFAEQMLATGERKHMIFLAPTVHLVEQQCEVIKNYTEVDAEHFHGSKGVDDWKGASWQEQLSKYQVLVMTPQIFLDALRKAFLTIDMFCLIVFDECHRAARNHPYSRIMTEFYHKSACKPKIFGMTASPLSRKGASSSTDCEIQLSELETLLDSQIYTFPDRAEMENFVPYAKEINRYYDPVSVDFDELKQRLELLRLKFDTSIGLLQDKNNVHDWEKIIAESRNKLSKCHKKILHCLKDVGLICAREATSVCLEAVRLPTEADAITAESASLHRKFYLEVLELIDKDMLPDYEARLVTEEGYLEATKLGYISPKLSELINIFRSFSDSEQVLCLIFVDRKIIARVIEQLMRKLSFFPNFSCAYLTGGNSSTDALTPRMQKEALNSFRCGKVNILFTTDVAEEGLDVPKCSCVIRFDLPRTTRSYVQSRGRARQMGSEYILMLERGNIQQRNLVFELLRSEYAMVDAALNRDSDPNSTKFCENGEVHEYCIKETGAKITTDSCVSLIYRYCDKLPKERLNSSKPEFQYKHRGLFYQCTVNLPANAAVHKVVGESARTRQKAKQLACLEACKKLHQCGALDNHLRLSGKEPVASGCAANAKRPSTHVKHAKPNGGEGSTKRKELHSTCEILDLAGSWIFQNSEVSLQGYKLDFVCNVDDYKYCNFVLLLDSRLDDDVASFEIDLYLRERMVRASVSPCGLFVLDKKKINDAKLFQELFFNGLFGKLFTGSKSSGTPREFLLKEDDTSLWSTSKMYFLLPLVSNLDGGDATIINWAAVSAAALSARSVICIHSQKGEAKIANSVVRCDDVIHMADKTAKRQEMKDMVVLAIHTGKMYIVLDVLNLTADSPFEEGSECSDFVNYSEYFSKKYQITLKHPGQPLLLLKHSHNPHNLLSSGNEDGYVKKQQNVARMPPELLVNISVSVDVMKSFYLFPSLMYRMESLMLASQLRGEVAFADSPVSSFLILQAITTLRSCEDFCLERLELLGDSVLKFSVSCYVFLKHPKKHEGLLSSERTRIICNATLHKLGVQRNIQGYIRDAAFEPRRWLAPGQLSIHHFPCECPVNEDTTKDIFVLDDKSILIGKPCDQGHRWICSKTIADCVEALIGAYYMGGGLSAAIAFLRWIGIETEVNEDDITNALMKASLWSYTPKADALNFLETKLGYSFSVRGLLLEAITHQSHQGSGGLYSYERLEFLGDAVLDLLITKYLFNTYTETDPGELTDLRSASVNNETFAQVAVRHNFHQYLLHNSPLLLQQITEYVSENSTASAPPKGPKALGDVVESITGALLIDTRLNLDTVWRLLEPLLSPIVTPESLELPPLRQLIEWCSHNGYFIKPYFENKPEMVVVTLHVQLKEVLLSRRVHSKTRKDGKAQAASLLLKDLEGMGLGPLKNGTTTQTSENKMDLEASALSEDTKISDLLLVEAAHITVKKVKGGPRMALYELCKRYQWPMPTFDAQKVEPSESNPCYDSAGHAALQCFACTIVLHIPNAGTISIAGDPQADKKSAQDSAALRMLREIQRRGGCSLEEV